MPDNKLQYKWAQWAVDHSGHIHFGIEVWHCPALTKFPRDLLRGNLQKKPSIFKDIIQIEVNLPPSHPIFDKFIFDKVLVMLTSLPPLEFLTKIMTF